MRLKRRQRAAALAWDPAQNLVAGLRQLGPKATAPVRAWIAKLADHAGVDGRYDFPRVPQRGLDVASALVSRWDAAKDHWEPVSAADRQAARAVAGRAPLVHQAAQVLIGGLLQGGVFAVVALGLSLVYRVTGVINLAQGGFCVLGALGFYSLSRGGVGLAGRGARPRCLTALFGADRRGNHLRAGAVSVIQQQHADDDRRDADHYRRAGAAAVGQPALRDPAVPGERPVQCSGWPCRPRECGFRRGRGGDLAVRWALAGTAVGSRAARVRREPNGGAADWDRRAAAEPGELHGGSAIGGVGGWWWRRSISLQFDTGHFFTNAGFIAVAIGGMGSFVGAVAGGIFLGVAEQLAAGYVSSLFSNGLALALLLVTLLWRPQGLFATGGQRRQDVRGNRASPAPWSGWMDLAPQRLASRP